MEIHACFLRDFVGIRLLGKAKRLREEENENIKIVCVKKSESTAPLFYGGYSRVCFVWFFFFFLAFRFVTTFDGNIDSEYVCEGAASV